MWWLIGIGLTLLLYALAAGFLSQDPWDLWDLWD